MKKILLYVLGISFCFLFVFISFEYFLRSIPNDFNTKQYYLNKNRKNIEVLILGSSHTFVGVNPVFLDKPSINLAYSSQTLDLDLQLFNRFKNRIPNLSTLIIPVSYFSYVLALEDTNVADKIKNYNIYYQLYSKNFLLKNQSEVLHQSLNENYIDFKNFMRDSDSKITIDSTGHINKRYIKYNLDWDESATHAAKNHTKNIHDKLIQQRISENRQALDDIITWCKYNHIKVILVSSPTTNAYIKKLNKEQYNHWRKTTKELATKYSNVIWLNYLDDNHLFQKEDFQNADHLNVKGAIKMTKLINQYL